MLRLLTHWQAILATMIASLAVVAAYTNVLTTQRQDALLDSARFDRVYDANQVVSELFRLEDAVLRYKESRTADAKDAVPLRLAILQSRVAILEQGEVRPLIATRPDAEAALRETVEGIAQVASLIELLDQPHIPDRILEVMAPIEVPTLTMSAQVKGIAADILGGQRKELANVYRKGVNLTICLIAFGAMLIVLLFRRNARVYELAHHDPLTGLPNRLAFNGKLGTLLAGANGPNHVAILLIDVDMFKNVNDLLGHAAGDQLLKTLSERLTSKAAGSVAVSRLGGDEFAILLAAEDAEAMSGAMAKRLCAVAAEPFILDGKPVSTGLSIGIAVARSNDIGPETLFKNADVALYAAKAAGRGTSRFFDPEMETVLRKRRDLETDLRAAVANDEFVVVFQPIVDLVTHEIVSCEALVRWLHPRRGLLSPLEFIPLAEETGLIRPIGEWVIRKACAEARKWPGLASVSINLSSKQFDGDGLVEVIEQALRRSGLEASRLELEITESILLRDADDVRQTLLALKALGVRIALDDFGTGYSSIGYLRRFPIDKIKIDQSFVREITTKVDAAMIVESIGALARNLGLVTTAEGIETDAHAVLVRKMGYTQGQGYHFDRPLSVEDCFARLSQSNIVKAA